MNRLTSTELDQANIENSDIRSSGIIGCQIHAAMIHGCSVQSVVIESHSLVTLDGETFTGKDFQKMIKVAKLFDSPKKIRKLLKLMKD